MAARAPLWRLRGTRSEVLRHQKGDRPHYQRHQLASRRSGGLDRARGFGSVACPLHQRNGDRSGRYDVGNRAALDRAEQAGRCDRHLGRTAAVLPHKSDRHVVEEFGSSTHSPPTRFNITSDKTCSTSVQPCAPFRAFTCRSRLLTIPTQHERSR